MASPIAITQGIAFAFPNVCLTPVPSSSPVPIPYPSIASLADAEGTASNVNAGGKPVLLKSSEVGSTSGDEAGTDGGVTSGGNGGTCTFTSASESVFANGEGIVRMGDSTDQNDNNAQGTVLAGLATVLVGG